jgi:hypothetical protein
MKRRGFIAAIIGGGAVATAARQAQASPQNVQPPGRKDKNVHILQSNGTSSYPFPKKWLQGTNQPNIAASLIHGDYHIAVYLDGARMAEGGAMDYILMSGLAGGGGDPDSYYVSFREGISPGVNIIIENLR